MTRLTALLPLSIIAAAVVFATSPAPAWANGGGHGHGGERGHHRAPETMHSDFAFGKPGDPSEARRTIRVVAKGNDFSPNKIAVRAGETVRFRIINQGELAHEFTVGTHAVQEEHQKEMAAMMDKGVLTATGIAEDAKDVHMHANSVIVEPGETEELVWTFAKARDIEFACNIPGHYEDGMHGDFIVH
jgi:uncharacterized cupredoxin-like copper-binding protein